jgi:hypothetical protein
MKSKSVITVAVASTIGWSAAAFAGPGHEVVTPFSPNESGEVLAQLQQQGFGSTHSSPSIGALSDSGSGTISGSYDSMSSSSSFSGTGDETASLSMGDSLAGADQGIYSDYYVIGWTPSTVDYYVIDDGGTPELVAISEFDVWMPTHELALVPSASDDMVYELTLVPVTFGDVSESAAD